VSHERTRLGRIVSDELQPAHGSPNPRRFEIVLNEISVNASAQDGVEAELRDAFRRQRAVWHRRSAKATQHQHTTG
jgi:hypothetical protein